MPLGKDDAPANKSTAHPASKAEVSEAVEDIVDSGAGAPPAQREAAEKLPEGNKMDAAIKEAYNADTAGDEAKAKKEVVDLSRDSHETPSGHALQETADIEDDVERGEEYNRIKMGVRLGAIVPGEEAKK